MDTAELIERLQNPDFYPHPVKSPIEIIKTHASIVLLTGDYAYKLKKPVNYGFLDFSTLAKRKYFIEQELALNKLTAPDIYLETLAITELNGQLSFQGTGKVVEYALKMNQFSQESLLGAISDRGELTEREIEALGKKVANFHKKAKTNDYITSFGDLKTIKPAFAQNYQQSEPYIGRVQTRQQYEETRAFTDNFFARHGDWLRERQEKAKIRECHGDLHLNNICLWHGEMQLFDRIEFNESFRFIDVMSDVAFTVMDLTARGRQDLGNLFLNTYLEQRGDWEGLKVLPLYLTRQAYVRAKVNSFLLEGDTFSETVQETARQYYKLAWEYTKARSGRLILMSGLSGSGKSTVAKVLAKQFNGIRIRSDAVRKHLARIELTETGNPEIYTSEMSQKTFDRLLELAEILFFQGYTVILDARFDRQDIRQNALHRARTYGVPCQIVHCYAPLEILRQRLEERKGDISDATPDLLNAQIAKTEPFSPEESPYLIYLDTTREDWQRELKTKFD